MTGKQIQQLRHSLGESVAQFAKRFGVSSRTVEAWEGGRNKPNRWLMPQIKQLAQKKGATK